MIERAARVTRLEGGLAWLSGKPAHCEACDRGEGCGGGLLGRLVGIRPLEFPARNPLGAGPGENVIVGLPERYLLAGAARLYGLPLAGVLIGALAGVLLVPAAGAAQDAATLAGAITGAAVPLAARPRSAASRTPAVVLRRGVGVAD